MFNKINWKGFFISTGIIAAVIGAANDEFTPPQLLTYYFGTVVVAAPATLASIKKEVN